MNLDGGRAAAKKEHAFITQNLNRNKLFQFMKIKFRIFAKKFLSFFQPYPSFYPPPHRATQYLVGKGRTREMGKDKEGDEFQAAQNSHYSLEFFKGDTQFYFAHSY